jgi:hypothetical protein
MRGRFLASSTSRKRRGGHTWWVFVTGEGRRRQERRVTGERSRGVNEREEEKKRWYHTSRPVPLVSYLLLGSGVTTERMHRREGEAEELQMFRSDGKRKRDGRYMI